MIYVPHIGYLLAVQPWWSPDETAPDVQHLDSKFDVTFSRNCFSATCFESPRVTFIYQSSYTTCLISLKKLHHANFCLGVNITIFNQNVCEFTQY
jgi:hypothetical protein